MHIVDEHAKLKTFDVLKSLPDKFQIGGCCVGRQTGIIGSIKVPIAPNKKGVCLQNTSKSHSCHLKIWQLL